MSHPTHHSLLGARFFKSFTGGLPRKSRNKLVRESINFQSPNETICLVSLSVNADNPGLRCLSVSQRRLCKFAVIHGVILNKLAERGQQNIAD